MEKRLGQGGVSIRPLLLLLAAVLFLGLLFLAWRSMQPPALRRVRLRGGEVVTLSGVTYGTVHVFDPVPPFQRYLEALHLAKDLPKPTSVVTSKPEVRLWYSFSSKRASAGDVYPLLHRFEDEHGCLLDEGSLGGVSADYGGNSSFSWQPSEAIPYGRPFDLCAVYEETSQEAFRFHIEPPSLPLPRPPADELEPLPLPQTVAAGGFSATLVSVQAVPGALPHYRAQIRGTDPQGLPLSPLWLTVTDRYGRRANRVSSIDRRRIGTEDFLFWGLCREEPVWKLTATFTRTPQPDTPADIDWVFPKVLVGGVSVTLRHGDKSLGVRCERTNPAPGRASQTVVWVEAGGRHNPIRLILTRINGQPVPRPPGAAGQRSLTLEFSPESGWQSGVVVPLPASSKAARLEFAEYSGHQVVFAVSPP